MSSYHTSIVAGLRNDIEKLLAKFVETESVRYEQFAQIWREMNFGLIYCGLAESNQERYFITSVFDIVLNYIQVKYNFQVRVGGLYLLYALYLRQPTKFPKVKIRVCPDVWKDMLSLVSEIRRQQHLDADYIFRVLRYDNAFLFTATQKRMLFNQTESSYDQSTDDTLFQDTPGVLTDVLEDGLLEQLKEIHDHYQLSKCRLVGPHNAGMGQSLNVANASLMTTLAGIIDEFAEWRDTSIRDRSEIQDGGVDEPLSQEEACSSTGIGSRRAEIKIRQFSADPQLVMSRRHRHPESSTSDESPTKRRTSKSPRKSIRGVGRPPNTTTSDYRPTLLSGRMKSPTSVRRRAGRPSHDYNSEQILHTLTIRAAARSRKAPLNKSLISTPKKKTKITVKQILNKSTTSPDLEPVNATI